ncbi:MAG: right-handed parallel beta-helix repeat-containing protein, partial [Cyanobacteria bacterium P01_A01_bin.135]
MGDSTVLSGFTLNGGTDNAIAASGVENVEIRDNTITNAGRGIFLNDVSGSVVLFDNVISDTTGGAGSGQGILINNTLSDAVEVSIARQEITDTSQGISVIADGSASATANPQQIVTIADTTVDDSGAEGLRFQADAAGNQGITVTDSVITDSGADGVSVTAVNTGSQEVTIEDSRIARSDGSGISVVAGTPDGSSTAAQEVFINDNRIANNDGDGISIAANEVATQEFGINGNTITGNGGGGIVAIAQNVAFQEFVTDEDNNSLGISNNTITGNGGQAISLTGFDSATVVADIQGNVSEGNDTTDGDLAITANDTTNDFCTFLSDNATDSSIQLTNDSVVPALFEVVQLPNVNDLNSSGVTFNPNQSVFTNVGGVDSCFDALED